MSSETQDHPSDSLTQASSLKSRRLSVHPSLRSIRPYGRPAPRPRSPFAYPSRLKRPGYRPSSPAFSEVNRSDSALHTGLHRAYSTRTTSPQSTSSLKIVPAVWNHGLNRSDPVLQHYQAVPLSRRHDRNRSPPILRRRPLRRSPLGSHRSSIISKSQVPSGSSLSSASGQGPPSTPLFYDYSEAFEKESFHHTASRSSLFMARSLPQSDGSSEGYQTDATNTSNAFAKDSSSSTDSKAITPERVTVKTKRPSPLTLVPQLMKQHPTEQHKESQGANFESTISKDAFITPPEEQQMQPFAVKDRDRDNESSSQTSELTSSKEEMVDPFTGPPPVHNELQYPPSAYNPAPNIIKTATLSMRFSSSSSGSQYSTSVHSGKHQTSNAMAIKVPSMVYDRQPKALSVSFNRLQTASHEAVDAEPQQRAASLDTRVRPEPYEILAPVPERSKSSRDSRDRFSRILSISDDFGKRDIFSVNPNKKAPMTIQQYLRDKKSHSPNTVASATKELPRLPDEASSIPDKGKSKEVDEPFAIGLASEQPNDSEKLLNHDQSAMAVNALEQLAAINEFIRPGIPPRYSSISRDSAVDQPRPSHSIRASILSQQRSIEQPRIFALPKRNSSLFQTMKELPPLPVEPVVAILPPQTPSPLELPHRFTPLMPENWLDTAVADIKDTPKSTHATVSEEVVQHQTPTRAFNVGVNTGGSSTASPASARPWNLDASYPWAGTPPKLEMSIPQVPHGPSPEVEKLSRFRLKFHPSSAPGNGAKLMKNRPLNIKVIPSPVTKSGSTPVQTRFVEGIENVQPATPAISLMPPSPGMMIEAQSFFSDDSSQKRRKRSLRRRFSQIRGMAMRTASSDDVRGSHPGRSTPAQGLSEDSKRSSKRSSAKVDEYTQNRSRRRKIFNRVKSWFHRHGAQIKKWCRTFDPRKHA